MRLPGERKRRVSKAQKGCREGAYAELGGIKDPLGCFVSPTSSQAVSVAQKRSLSLGVRETQAARTRPSGHGPGSEQSLLHKAALQRGGERRDPKLG